VNYWRDINPRPIQYSPGIGEAGGFIGELASPVAWGKAITGLNALEEGISVAASRIRAIGVSDWDISLAPVRPATLYTTPLDVFEFKPVPAGTFTRIPRTDGYWTGQPGESSWYSFKPEVNDVTGGQPIQFIGQRPDFSPWAHSKISFELGVLNGSEADFHAVYDAVARAENLPSRNAASNLLRELDLTPHHVDATTIQLVPIPLHSNIPHVGSAADLRRIR
jgi:hypothetical protein